jgi:hypothetical protein
MYKTREIFAKEIGMCARTMMRKLDEARYEVPPYKLLSPETQEEIKKVLKII